MKEKSGFVFPERNPSRLGFGEQRTRRLLAVLNSEIERKRLPGAVVLIARYGKIGLFESLGQQDPVRGTPMARDSLFRIYSMTKPLVSVAVMLLMEQGLLLLSDSVAKHLPEYAGQKLGVERDGQLSLHDIAQPATIHDLLRHTAGLTYDANPSLVSQQYARAKLASRDRSSAEFSQVLAGLPLVHAPGTMWEYSRATDVLGRLVEVLSGQKLGDFLRRHIFEPLGMVDTGFAVPPEDHGRLAEPFAQDPDSGAPVQLFDARQAPAFESGGGGLISTAMDYARFLQFMQNRGELGVRLLAPGTVKFMTADHLGNIPSTGTLLPAGHGFGLGFAVRKETGLSSMPGSPGTYHWGGISGTTFWVDPAEEMFALMMIQAPNQRDYYRPLFRSLVYAALVD
jgi:CubicO group peptidase (beta-lactamase class C family)